MDEGLRHWCLIQIYKYYIKRAGKQKLNQNKNNKQTSFMNSFFQSRKVGNFYLGLKGGESTTLKEPVMKNPFCISMDNN